MPGVKVLIIGNGFLGQKMAGIFRAQGFEVSSADVVGAELELDLTDKESVYRAFEAVCPDVVVLTAGLTNVDYCEENPSVCFKVNVQGTEHVAEACQAFDARMAFISSDFVFDGEKGGYSEEDEVNALNVYGQSKVEGERIVSRLPGHLILRTSTLYGFNGLEDKMNFVKWVASQLRADNRIKIVSDQRTNPTLIDDLSLAALRLIESKEEGVFHCVGSEAISRYAFVEKIIDAFGLDKSLLEETDSTQFVQKARRPPDSSLSIAKLGSKGIRMRDCGSGLREMKRQMASAGR